jgi:endonuclease III
MNSAKRHEIFACLKSTNPHPTTELEYRSPFELLIAVILIGASYRQKCQSGNTEIISSGQYSGENSGFG